MYVLQKKSLQRNMARCIINTCGYRKIKGEDIFLMRVPTEAKFSEDWMKVFNSPPPSIHSPKDIVYIFQLFKGTIHFRNILGSKYGL